MVKYILFKFRAGGRRIAAGLSENCRRIFAKKLNIFFEYKMFYFGEINLAAVKYLAFHKFESTNIIRLASKFRWFWNMYEFRICNDKNRGYFIENIQELQLYKRNSLDYFNSEIRRMRRGKIIVLTYYIIRRAIIDYGRFFKFYDDYFDCGIKHFWMDDDGKIIKMAIRIMLRDRTAKLIEIISGRDF